LVGVVTLHSLRAFLFDDELNRVVIAADCVSPLVSVTPDDTLDVALERFAASHHTELPVIDAAGSVVGLITYGELLRAYNRELAKRRLEMRRAAA
jgi:CIC family chloride channel protein